MQDLWWWDLNGYLVVPVMDDAWVAQGLASIERFKVVPDLMEEVPEAALRQNEWVWPADTSPRLSCPVNGVEFHRPRLGHLYELPAPWAEPFHKMSGCSGRRPACAPQAVT